MTDKSGKFTFACGAATPADTPCKSCAGAIQSGDCKWTWTAPKTTADAVAVSTPPTSSKCRCTDYNPNKVVDWLCGGFTGCPGTPAGRRHLKAFDPRCPAAYTGSPRCFIQDNWAQIMQLQGRGTSDALIVGSGDRTVGLNLEALKCACSAWSLTGKTLTQKTTP
jgi:hypothetical protein